MLSLKHLCKKLDCIFSFQIESASRKLLGKLISLFHVPISPCSLYQNVFIFITILIPSPLTLLTTLPLPLSLSIALPPSSSTQDHPTNTPQPPLTPRPPPHSTHPSFQRQKAQTLPKSRLNQPHHRHSPTASTGNQLAHPHRSKQHNTTSLCPSC
jgi:hypothetical protein